MQASKGQQRSVTISEEISELQEKHEIQVRAERVAGQQPMESEEEEKVVLKILGLSNIMTCRHV